MMAAFLHKIQGMNRLGILFEILTGTDGLLSA